MQTLHSPSNFTPTSLASSSPISANPNPNPTPTSPHSVAAPKSPMAESFSVPTVAEADANKENICPVTRLVANSTVSHPKKRRRRFVRKPLADITNQFNQHNSACDRLLGNSDGQKKTVKRKADLGDFDGSRSKTLRINFR